MTKRRFFSVAFFALTLTGGVWAWGQTAAPSPLSALLVGGGPSPKYNQVAIESNVRYVDGLLPTGAARRILFTDGKGTANVLFQEPDKAVPEPEAAFQTLFDDRSKNGAAKMRFRAPQIRSIDGASQQESLSGEISRLASNKDGKNGPILLYFTGHGSPAKTGDLDNNVYDMWSGQRLSVRELAQEIKKLPANRPVVLVMVQCYGGAFANVLFENGKPDGDVITRPFCGFFATTRERVAAGCTPEVNEANYHDFTSSFFAALSGKDRTGKTVGLAADYDKSGMVGMDEAFTYALVSEPSVDVPVCTSDAFLRRFVAIKDDSEIANLPYSTVRAMASPLQQTALDGLSKLLGVTGEERLKIALADVRSRVDSESRFHTDDGLAPGAGTEARIVLADWNTRLRAKFPGLRDKATEATFTEAKRKAVEFLTTRPADVTAILAAGDRLDRAYDGAYQDELKGARWLRLMRVAKTAVLETRLRKSGNAALIARFNALKNQEKQSPLR